MERGRQIRMIEIRILALYFNKKPFRTFMQLREGPIGLLIVRRNQRDRGTSRDERQADAQEAKSAKKGFGDKGHVGANRASESSSSTAHGQRMIPLLSKEAAPHKNLKDRIFSHKRSHRSQRKIPWERRPLARPEKHFEPQRRRGRIGRTQTSEVRGRMTEIHF